jgi:hypothetical protein
MHLSARIDVPTLVKPGDVDRILSITASGSDCETDRRSATIVVEGRAQAVNWTHAVQVNRALPDFLGRGNPRGRLPCMWKRGRGNGSAVSGCLPRSGESV